MQAKEQMNGMRPFEEIQRLVTSAIEVKPLNPKMHYKILESIGKGGFATIFKCRRLSDGNEVVLKHTGKSNSER